MKKQTYISLTIVIVAFIGVIAILVTNKNKSPSTSGTTGSSNSMGMMVDNNSIAVSGQGETNTLIASMGVLSDPGYIVVHEDNNGQPGNIIGVSKLVAPGMIHGVSVTLSRKAVAGEKLYAMLHKDNGDKTYSDADAPVMGKNGEPIMMNVTVQIGATTEPGAMSM